MTQVFVHMSALALCKNCKRQCSQILLMKYSSTTNDLSVAKSECVWIITNQYLYTSVWCINCKRKCFHNSINNLSPRHQEMYRLIYQFLHTYPKIIVSAYIDQFNVHTVKKMLLSCDLSCKVHVIGHPWWIQKMFSISKPLGWSSKLCSSM